MNHSSRRMCFPNWVWVLRLANPISVWGEEDRLLWARLPILSSNTDVTVAPSITVTDGENRAFTIIADRVAQGIAPPFELAATTPDMMELIWIAAIALLGGLILNVMPCVLPVLSIKVSSVLKHTDHDTTRVRFGFVAASAGIMTFMWGLALVLWALQTAGLSVGWGLQFQSPLFLAVMIAVLLVFSANLFGAFEFALPHGIQTRLAGAGGRNGYSADFFTWHVRCRHGDALFGTVPRHRCGLCFGRAWLGHPHSLFEPRVRPRPALSRHRRVPASGRIHA